MSKATSSTVVPPPPPQPLVFINFRGRELRRSFVSHLVKALKDAKINVFIDNQERMGRDLKVFFKRIEQSRIAIAVISSLYTESDWCLDELAKIKRCVKKETLEVFPVFYKVPVDMVRYRTHKFGENFDQLVEQYLTKRRKWRRALRFVTDKIGEVVDEISDEVLAINRIVMDVKLKLEEISTDQGTKSPTEKLIEFPKENLGGEPESSSSKTPPLFGLETRLEQLKEKLDFESREVTRVVGVVGMPGIGKTTLAKKLLHGCGWKFDRTMFLDDVGQNLKSLGFQKLLGDILCGLKNRKYDGKVPLESLKAEFRESKVFIVLEDVTEESQIRMILGEREWFKEGSKVIITTSSKSVVEGMVDETYLVPGLSDNDALKYFERHAFSGSCGPSFKKLAREIVDYTMGNPLVLKVLGGELLGENEAHWRLKLQTLAKSPMSNTIQKVLRIPYDDLSTYHKDLFLDVACFFRFEDEFYVRALLDSSEHTNVSEIRDLADKFLINICGGRIEMNDLMYTLAMGLESQSSSESTSSWRRLLNHDESVTAFKNKEEAENVRGIFFNMSEVERMSLDSDTFEKMKNLRYLKLFDSTSPKGCEADCNLNLPNGIKSTLQEIRYLDWLKFPLKNLPGEFKPENLIDLKLPYSQIEQVWEGEKDTPKLKWLDLNHSSKLRTLSGLSLARKLQSMNLEGCTALKTIHKELQNMESLVFLNLRGCTSLESLPDMNLISLKTVILSGCSNLEEYNLISKNLEELYLDGTAIKGLPSEIGNLQRLVLLILKDCKRLLSLPDSIGNLQALEKLVLSGCSSFASFPEVKENLKHLKTLLLDGTAIKERPQLLHRFSVNQGQTSSWSHSNLREWPHGIYGLSSVQRLCLSRNNCKSLPNSIRCLYNLKWLDLKYCDQLISLPMLPPNLHCLDAHGCISLENIESPLALISVETEHSASTFIFTNCTKLDQVAKNGIVAYVGRKIQLMSDAPTHQDKGSILDASIGVCYPGWQLPVWFNYRSFQSKLKQKLPRDWKEDGFTGVALCTVVSFKDYRAQNNRLLVRCTGEFKEEDVPLIQFSCILGGWTEHSSDRPRGINKSSDHVFIGYTNLVDIKKRERGGQCKASFKFEVTDGTEQITNCEVLKCGFTLIYAPTKPVQSLCTETHSGHGEIMPGSITDTGGNIRGEESGATSETTEEVNLFEATRNAADIIRCPASSRVKSEVPMEDRFHVTPKIGDSISGESESPGSSEKGEVIDEESPLKEETIQELETSSCVSLEDTEKSGNEQSLTNKAKNFCELLEKPIRLICLVISVYAVGAFVLRKEKRRR